MPANPVPRHADAPPDLEALLRGLDAHRVRHVVVGSVAALLHGVAVDPADLDVVPDPARENLVRLIAALRRIEAQPRGPFGRWVMLGNGEAKWESRPTSAEELAAWTPDPDDVATLDHLFLTRHGNLDVVPAISGRYDTLIGRAAWRTCGVEVAVAHVDELLARLTVPRRPKDVARVAALRDLQRGGGT